MVDLKAIEMTKEYGLTDPAFLSGRMSNETLQKINYMKTKHRSNFLLQKWSSDQYWTK